jgi:hypothetical protein
MSLIQQASRSSPLGATVGHGGTDFSAYSRGPSSVELLLFDREHLEVVLIKSLGQV